jgi:hypothetical protein
MGDVDIEVGGHKAEAILRDTHCRWHGDRASVDASDR